MKFLARTLVGTLFGILTWSVQAQTAAPFSSAAQSPASSSSVWGSAWLGLVTLSMLVVLVAEVLVLLSMYKEIMFLAVAQEELTPVAVVAVVG